jgi:hypothetical protein
MSDAEVDRIAADVWRRDELAEFTTMNDLILAAAAAGVEVGIARGCAMRDHDVTRAVAHGLAAAKAEGAREAYEACAQIAHAWWEKATSEPDDPYWLGAAQQSSVIEGDIRARGKEQG